MGGHPLSTPHPCPMAGPSRWECVSTLMVVSLIVYINGIYSGTRNNGRLCTKLCTNPGRVDVGFRLHLFTESTTAVNQVGAMTAVMSLSRKVD